MNYLITLLFIFFTGMAAANTYTGKAVFIPDADTVHVKLNNGKTKKVRLAGIDCPEKSQPYGAEATQALRDLIHMKKIKVVKITKGKYGRDIARIFLNDQNINRQLVGNGHCWVYPQYAKDRKLFLLEDRARESGLGLWALPETQRIEPWKFRRYQR